MMSSPATDNDDAPHVTPAQGKPALSENDPPPDVQAAFGDDAAGAVGSSAPLQTHTSPVADDEPLPGSGG